MSKRDNDPDLDFYELRRRHQEYKSRMRAAQSAAQTQPEEDAPTPQDVLHPDEIQDASAVASDVTTGEAIEEQDPLASFVLSDEESDEDELDEEPAANANPFGSFIHAFHRVKQNMTARREAREEAELEALDDDLTDEELSMLDEAEEIEESSSRQRASRQSSRYAEDIPEEESEEKPRSIFSRFSHSEDEISDGEDNEAYVDDGDYVSDEDYVDDEGEAPRKSMFQRILGLFVSRVDEEEEEADEEYYEDEDDLDEGDADAPEDEELDFEDVSPAPTPSPAGASRHAKPAAAAQSKVEGGQSMDDSNKPLSAIDPRLAQALEASGMTRRERRERAMRQAAEEAARKAADEAKLQAAVEEEEAGRQAESVVAESSEESSDSAVKPLFDEVDTQSVAPESTSSQDVGMPVSDEPTQEFKPVRRSGKRGNSLSGASDAGKDAVQDEDEEEERTAKPRFGLFSRNKRVEDEDEDLDDEDEDLDDEDEDAEERPTKSRFPLFGRRKRTEEDEDEEEDDEDEEEDDEDEEDEDERPAKRRFGLFGRRKLDVEDDDEDYEDDEDDLDDEEEDADEEVRDERPTKSRNGLFSLKRGGADDESDYEDDEEEDEYDEYEDDEESDDEDDYDEFDEEEVHRSFGYHVVGVLKWVLRIIVFLLVVVIALNFLYVTGTDTIVPAMHDAMGDSTAFNFLFFGYKVRKVSEDGAYDATDTESDVVQLDEIDVVSQTAPDVTIPNLDEGSDDAAALDAGDASLDLEPFTNDDFANEDFASEDFGDDSFADEDFASDDTSIG